jgi:hypothetical protein
LVVLSPAVGTLPRKEAAGVVGRKGTVYSELFGQRSKGSFIHFHKINFPSNLVSSTLNAVQHLMFASFKDWKTIQIFCNHFSNSQHPF